MDYYLFTALGLAVSATLSPGPMQTYLISSTLAYGWRRSIVIIFAPLVVDIPIIVLTTFVLTQLPPLFLRLIQIGGGLFLMTLAWSLWCSAQHTNAADTTTVPEISRAALFRRALLMNALSHGPWIFWTTISGPLLAGALRQSIGFAAVFLVGFYVTFLGLMGVMVALFDRLRGLNAAVTRSLIVVSAAITLVMALVLLWNGVTG